MDLQATLANCLWMATNVPADAKFGRALRAPEAVQRRKLADYLKVNAGTAFGQSHGFDWIRSYEEFARRVPIRTYEEFVPWIERIRAGEQGALTAERVARLVPTSGSSSARKLIPFTAGLQREFNAAIGSWLADLALRDPRLLGGPAYWSITPVLRATDKEPDGPVPIGFDADTEYLGGVRRRFVERTMAVPSEVRLAPSVDVFRYLTLLALLRCRELRLISVWHPSFLSLLCDALAADWDSLLQDVELGTCRFAGERWRAKPMACRARELHAIGRAELSRLWPNLRLISCWGDGPAAVALAHLRTLFPGVPIQPKGLVATEAFVTLPFRGCRPLAIRSHFFEFLDDGGTVHLAHSLREGFEYEVVVSTGAGLYRYRFGDRVRVTGFVGRTPCLEFLARPGDVSDQCGEKLSERFVHQAYCEAIGPDAGGIRFALVAPDCSGRDCHYTLYLEGDVNPQSVARLDHALCRNPHYAWCRDLGQLRAVRLFRISAHGYRRFAERQAGPGSAIGQVKPALLSPLSGWSDVFDGKYVS